MNNNYKESTLMGWTKRELVDYCMCLQHNNRAMEQNFNNQYHNCLKLLDDMKLVNDTYLNRHKEGIVK